MKKNVMVIMVEKREKTAERVQKTLTGWGCLIKTRLGLHGGVMDNCSEHGLIILELEGKPADNKELKRKLGLIKGVSAKLVVMSPSK